MKYFLLLLTCATIYSCVSKHPEQGHDAPMHVDSLRVELMNADKAWSDLAAKEGYYHSRAAVVTDNSIAMRQGAMPLVGRQEILNYTASHPDTGFMLQWNPLRADVAASGDLGYTYGAWTMKTKTKAGADTTIYGNYVTVWQRQEDGSWKFLIDGGNDTPSPVQ